MKEASPNFLISYARSLVHITKSMDECIQNVLIYNMHVLQGSVSTRSRENLDTSLVAYSYGP